MCGAGSCRILVMDDEPALLRLMTTCLGRLGHQVDTTLTGAEAWTKFSNNPHAYDLFIADLSMSDVNVAEMIEQFATMNRHVSVMVCSGNPFDLRTIQPGLRPRVSVLAKPFTPAMLAGAVGSACRGQGQESAVA